MTTAPEQHATALRALFPDLRLETDDLFLLEAFQVEQLPERAPARALAALLGTDPRLRRYFAARAPRITPWLDQIEPAPTQDVELVLWALADWIVYQRYPDRYDALDTLRWNPSELTSRVALDGLVVVDAGAGTGWLTEAIAERAATVIAVEPVAALRRYIRERVARPHVHVTDGLLDRLPLQSATIDVLVTSRAIGWRIEDELAEVDRVLRPGGHALHFTGSATPPPELATALVSRGYVHDSYDEAGTPKRLYHKRKAP